jgi:hypothetical protein
MCIDHDPPWSIKNAVFRLIPISFRLPRFCDISQKVDICSYRGWNTTTYLQILRGELNILKLEFITRQRRPTHPRQMRMCNRLIIRHLAAGSNKAHLSRNPFHLSATPRKPSLTTWQTFHGSPRRQHFAAHKSSPA